MTTLKDHLIDLAAEVKKIVESRPELDGEDTTAMKDTLIDEAIEETLDIIKERLIG